MEHRKILFVITKSNWGGAQAYVFALATRFAAEGHDVTVALGGTGQPGASTGQLAERLAAAHIRVVHLEAMARDISFSREVRSFQELCTVIQDIRPDVLHLNSSKAGLLGSFAGRVCGVPRIIFTAHGWPHREPRPFLMRGIIWIASWATILFSHAVIAVSECDYQTSPVFLSRQKIHMIHNGIRFYSVLARDTARAALAPNIPPNAFWFLMSAELHPNKGIDRALRSLAALHTDFPDAYLVIMGNGEHRSSLEALAKALGIAENVIFAGFIPDARTYLPAADAFLLPSRKEGLPMVLLEAGVAALPVIASDTGGIPEVILDSHTGILMHDEENLTKAMLNMIKNPADGRRLGDALQNHVRTMFSEDRMVAETLALYR